MSNNPASFQEAVKQGHSAAWDQAWDKAAIYYRQALEASPDNPAVLIDFGLALYQLQNYPEALKVYQRAAEVSPNDPLPLQKIAEINERLGSVRPAADAYWKSAELNARNRDMDKAIEHWSHVSRLDPGNIMAHSRLALVYERLGKKQQAVTELLAIGSLMQRAGDLQKAIQAVTHAMQVVPDSKEATQALSLLRAGQQLPRPISRESRAATPAAHSYRQIEAPKEVSLPKSSLDPIGEARQRALASLAALVFEQPDEAPQGGQTSRGMQAIVQGV
ncbi:MAG: tetratricopeptide repeat protein, partial [Omnitrophica WOR_2 bacterium]